MKRLTNVVYNFSLTLLLVVGLVPTRYIAVFDISVQWEAVWVEKEDRGHS